MTAWDRFRDRAEIVIYLMPVMLAFLLIFG